VAELTGACVIFIGLVLAFVAAILLYRGYWLNPDRSTDGTPWTFDDLRKLREKGEITNEEYETLRATLIGSFRNDGVASPLPGPEPEWDWVAEGGQNGDSDGNQQDFDLKK